MTVNVQKRKRCRIRRSFKPAVPLKSDRLYLLSTVCVAAGMLAGAYSAAYSGEQMITGGSFTDCFFGSLASVMLYILLFFFGGLSSVGAVAAVLLCIFKGMGAGFIAYGVFGTGIWAADMAELLNFLPFEAMSITAVIFAARENIRMSGLVSRRSFGGDKSASSEDALRLYIMKFCIIALFAAFAAVIDGLMAVVSGNFS